MGSSTWTNKECHTLLTLKIKHNLTFAHSKFSAVFCSQNDSFKPSNLLITYINLEAKLSSTYYLIIYYLFTSYLLFTYLLFIIYLLFIYLFIIYLLLFMYLFIYYLFIIYVFIY